MSVVNDCSFFDFSHDITCAEKRQVAACVKTYDTTGTYITVTIFKKDNFRDTIQDNKNNNKRKQWFQVQPDNYTIFS